jgi:hypothetical protein
MLLPFLNRAETGIAAKRMLRIMKIGNPSTGKNDGESKTKKVIQRSLDLKERKLRSTDLLISWPLPLLRCT